LEESVTNGCRQLNGISVSEMAMNVSDTENYDVIELIKKINLFTQG